MKKSKLFCTLLASAAFVVGILAQASPIIRLSDGNPLNTVEVADGQVGPTPDLNALAGAVTYVGVVGANWSLNVTTGISASPAGSLDLTSVNASNVGAGTFLDIFLTDTDFSLGGLALLGEFLGKIGGTTDGMVTWWMYVDDANNPFAETTLIGTGSNAGDPFASSFLGTANVDGTFSMTLQVRINHNNRGPEMDLTSFDFRGGAIPFRGVPIPEPGTIALLGVGLLGLILLRRRNA